MLVKLPHRSVERELLNGLKGRYAPRKARGSPLLEDENTIINGNTLERGNRRPGVSDGLRSKIPVFPFKWVRGKLSRSHRGTGDIVPGHRTLGNTFEGVRRGGGKRRVKDPK